MSSRWSSWNECAVGPLWVGVCFNVYFDLAPLRKFFSYKDDLEYTKEDIDRRFEQRAIDGDEGSQLLLSPQLFALLDTCVFAITRSGNQGKEDED
jgi:hypothetical protein